MSSTPARAAALVVAAAAGHVLVTGDGPAPSALLALTLAAALWLAALALLGAVVPERRPGFLPQVGPQTARRSPPSASARAVGSGT
jgi:hypothetical protein